MAVGVGFISLHDLSEKYKNILEPVQAACKIVATDLTSFTSLAIPSTKKRSVIIIKNKLLLDNERGELVTPILENDEEIIMAYNK